MEVRTFEDVAAFLDAAGPWLRGDTARNNLLLGICGTLAKHPEVYPAFHLWVAQDDGRIGAAALMTEPHNVVVAEPTSEAALDALAAAIVASGAPVPGVLANVPWAERVAAAWGATSRVVMAQGVYAADRVLDVPAAAGAFRTATWDDVDAVRPLLLAFFVEALPEHPERADRLEQMLHVRLRSSDAGADERFWVWEVDGEPVSLSGHTAIDGGGARIGPVYTPPEHRGHGYATNLVAAHTRWLLERGAGPAFLYTDLANPTSNAIYARIGYERVCDAEERTFATG